LSLTGNLEDLPLLDIIQIVSFSKKTGHLSIHVDDRAGAIVFQSGLVVCAFTWDTPELDARAELLPAATHAQLVRTRIEIALEQLIRLREGQFGFSLAENVPATVVGRPIARETLRVGINAQELLLNLARGIDEDRRDSSDAIERSFADPALAEEDEPALASSADGPDGEAQEPTTDALSQHDLGMTSAAADDEPPTLSTMLAADAGHEAPPPGRTAPVRPLTPEDVERQAALAQQADEAEEPAAGPESGSIATVETVEPLPRRILLVDDEDDVRQMLALRFAEAGYNVEEAGSPEEAVKMATRLSRAGADFLLVTDLGMPASGGASFQGGFEVVKRLWKMNLQPPVLMMSETLNATVRARARQMNIANLVFKPGLSRLDGAQFESDVGAFADRLVAQVLPRLGRGGVRRRSERRAEAPADTVTPSAEPDELARQIRLLQQRLEDLRRSGDAARIAVLVMKVAREFFERALLLLVKNDELRGLGGFGPAPRGAHLNLLAREIAIPLGEPSVFLDVVSTRRPYAGPPPEGRWSGYLLGRIGRFRTTGFTLIPLLTHRQTTAVLFGDNPETGLPFRRMEALEVFVDQAGMALENVFLQRKIQALQADASDRIQP
jgi:CheY-like chemotaxis protein